MSSSVAKGGPLAGRWVWILCLAGYLLVMGCLARWAPGGAWDNLLYDLPLWENHDPGGWYLASSHELLTHPQAPLFAGHPGLTLQVPLQALQALTYAMRPASWKATGYSDYIAQHIYAIWLAADVLMLGLHAVGFWLVYVFSRELSRDPRCARLSTLLYATSLPVLFYATRVSVEPILVLCILGAFLAAWRCRDTAVAGLASRAYGWALLAGLCAMAAVLTKLQLALPLPLIIAGVIVLEGRTGSRLSGGAGAWRYAVTALVAGVLTVWIGSSVIDWRHFLATWAGVAVQNEAAGVMDVTSSISLSLLRALRQLSPLSMMPAMTRSNLFFFCEFGLLALGLFGMLRYFCDRAMPRGRALGVVIFSLFPAGIWLYRAGMTDFHGFHYLFPLWPLATLLAAHGVERLWGACCGEVVTVEARGGWKEAAGLLLVTLVVHHTAIWCVVNSRLQDRRLFTVREAALRQALQETRPGDRVVVPGDFFTRPLAGITIDMYNPRDARSALVDALQARFVQLPDGLPLEDVQAWCERAGTRGRIGVDADGHAFYTGARK